MARPRKRDDENIWESKTYKKAYCYNRNGVAWMYAYHEGELLRKTTHFKWEEQNKDAALQLLDQRVMTMIHPELLPKKPARLVTLQEAQAEFWGVKDKELTVNQRTHYRRAFNKYFDGLDSTYILEDESLYKHLIERNKVAAVDLADSTREKYLQYLRSFLNFCNQRKYLLENPIGGTIEMPDREEKEDVAIYEPEEMQEFIEYYQEKAKDETHLRRNQRNAALFALCFRFLYLTGMRSGEALKLQWSHIDERAFKIYGKRERDKKPRIRYFPLVLGQLDHQVVANASSVNRIEAWLADIRQVIKELREWEGCFGFRGKVFPWQSPTSISQALSKAKEEINEKDPLNPKYPEDDDRAVRAIRATAINRWEDDLGIDWVTACDLAGHNPAVRYKYYRKKRTPERIIAAITRDAARIAGLDQLQVPYKTPSIN